MNTDVEERHPADRIRRGRRISGSAAVLLPFDQAGGVAWEELRAHIERTQACGLTPAVNMDTGYAHLIDKHTRRRVLREAREVLGSGPFISGAFVRDRPGDAWNPDAYRRQIDAIAEFGGTPIVFQSYGLTAQPSQGIVASYAEIGEHCDAFIAFELGEMFAPFGKIYDLETFAGLLEIPACVGAKHSSLSRRLEWQRLDLRDARREDFKIYTGNDLAIDMVMYGSDYLLGLATFAPDLFARRDGMWERGDPDFYELNDRLQYLGFFAFRPPVPGYRHSAAQFLKLRGWIECDAPHPDAERRPESDVAVLESIGRELGVMA